MAILNILTPDELANREQKPAPRRTGRRRSAERTRAIEEFKAGLAQATPGYGADVLLAENEDKRIVRQNLKAAAADLGIALDFRPIKDRSRIHFRVITAEEKAAKPPRGGRPPKNRQAQEAQAAPEAEVSGEMPRKQTRRRSHKQQEASAEQ